jgi:flavin reductase (DIM6/NTAB) family NADH-FMN oxidoreductase RutF
MDMLSAAATLHRPGRADLRRVLGQFVTGVTVVTGLAGDQPIGMTVNSFTPVSLDPPLVAFCAQTTSTTGRELRRYGAFAVNILGGDQQEVAERFARRGESRFAGLRVRPGATGSPILEDSLAFFDCRVADEFERGDHVVILGEIVEMGVLRESAHPLAFFRGFYAGT